MLSAHRGLPVFKEQSPFHTATRPPRATITARSCFNIHCIWFWDKTDLERKQPSKAFRLSQSTIFYIITIPYPLPIWWALRKIEITRTQ